MFQNMIINFVSNNKKSQVQDVVSSFLAYPQFQQKQAAAYFDYWKRAGLDRFYNLCNESGLLFEEQIIGQLEIFQYKQIRNLIHSLSKCYVVFHPLKKFEIWIKNMAVQKNLLSKLYNLLSSFWVVEKTPIIQGERDLNMEITNSVWGKNLLF